MEQIFATTGQQDQHERRRLKTLCAGANMFVELTSERIAARTRLLGRRHNLYTLESYGRVALRWHRKTSNCVILCRDGSFTVWM